MLFWGRWQRLKLGAVAAVLAGLALLPLYRMHQKALEPERYARGTEETIQYSAPLESFLATSSWNRLYGEATDRVPRRRPEQPVPGPRGAGAGRGRRARAPAARASGPRARPGRSRRSSLAAALVALGPRIRVFGADLGPGPWALLRETLPVFQMIRVTSRAGVFLALPLAMLAALALETLKPRSGRARGSWACWRWPRRVIAPIPMPEWSKVIDTRREPPRRLPLAGRAARPRPGGAPADARRVRARAPARLPREHLHGLLDAALEAARERLRRDRAAPPTSSSASCCASFPSSRVARGAARRGHPLVVVHRKGYGPQPVGAAAERMPEALGSSLRELAVLGTDTVYELLPKQD